MASVRALLGPVPTPPPPDIPANEEAERFVLAQVFLDGDVSKLVALHLTGADFYHPSNQKIFLRMLDVHASGEAICRVTIGESLQAHGQLELVTLSYLVALSEGMPVLVNLESYVRIIKHKSQLRQLISIGDQLRAAALGGGGDPVEIAAEAAVRLADVVADTSGDSIASLGTILDTKTDFSALVSPHLNKGLATGFLKFDSLTGGMRDGELIILAARPAMGKTALALNIVTYVATRKQEPRAVAVFSLEMSKESLLQRMACSIARVDLQRFRGGFLNDVERGSLMSAMGVLHDAPIFVNDQGALGILEIEAEVLKVKDQSGVPLGLVVVDYLQLMTGKGDNRQQEISSLTRGFKLLSKALHVPFLVLSQLSRAPEIRPGDHRPMLSDLRESGSIEQDGDLVGFIFREEIYRPDKESLKGIAELILAKQRNGPTGRVKLAYLSKFTKFENLASDSAGEEEEFHRGPDDDDGGGWAPSGGGLFTPSELEGEVL